MAENLRPPFDFLKQTLRWWERFQESERGLLILNWFLRQGALIGVTYYFVWQKAMFSSSELATIRYSLLLFFIYNVITGFLGILHVEWFLIWWVKLTQALLELGFYSLFFLLSKDPRSEIFLLFFIPLLVSTRFLEPAQVTLVGFLASACLYFIVLRMSNLPETGLFSNPLGFTAVYLPRQIFLLGAMLVFTRRRPSVIKDLEERAEFTSVFKSMEEGVYVVDESKRLLFVNDSLQARHGAFTPGIPCYLYFLCQERHCEWPDGNQALQPADLLARQDEFVDQDGAHYPVQVSLHPFLDETGHLSSAIGVVKDLDQPRKVEMQWREQVRQYDREIQSLISQRALWHETVHAMSKKLSGSENWEDLLDFVVSETLDRLRAESSSLFLLEDRVLRRKAIAGLDRDWLPDERYKPGEGITGQVIVPAPGSKYGRSIRRNNVNEDPQVVSQYLAQYEHELPTHQVKHLLAAPLNGQDYSFGALRVVNKLDHRGRISPDGFTRADEEFLETIASMVAIALENNRLLKETRQRFQEVETLYGIASRITQASDLGELLSVIVDETRETLSQAGKAAIYLIDQVSGEFYAAATSEEIPSRSGLPPIRGDEGIGGRSIRERRLIYIPDTRQEPDFLERGDPELSSILVAPLLVGSDAIGFLSVDSDQLDAFTLSERQLLEAFAGQAALAIEKAQLYRQESERRQQADAMLVISRALNSDLNLKRLLTEVLDRLGGLVEFDSISIQLVMGGWLKVYACQGFEQPQKVIRLAFPLGNPKYPNVWVVDNKRPLRLDDVRERYPHFIEESEKYQSGLIRSWMGVPLINRGKTIGMIAFDHKKTGFYTPEMESLATMLANQVAIAVANAQLFLSKSRQMSNLDKLYKASRVIASSLDIETVLKEIVTLAEEVANSEHTGVVLVGEGGELQTSVETRQVGIALHERARPNGVTARVIQSKRPVFFYDVSPSDARHNPIILKNSFRSYAGLPILISGQVRGVLFVHSSKPRRFRRKKKLLRTFCNHAAVAIENAIFYRRATGQTEMLYRLVELSSGLIQHVSLDSLLEYCAQQTARIFEVEDCSIYLRNAESQTIDLACSSAIPAPDRKKFSSLLSAPGLTAHVANTCETLNFGGQEYRQHPAWGGHHKAPFQEHLDHLPSKECHSLLMGPLKDSQGDCVGVLKLENRRGLGAGKRFTDFDEALHKTLASHIGTAVERSRFYQQLDKEARKKAREELGNDLHDISSFIHGALIMGLGIAREKLELGNKAGAKDDLESLSKAALAVNSSLRWIHNELRGDVVLQEQGLIPALMHFAALQDICLEPEPHVTGREVLPLDVEYSLYKIGLEALNNAAKHARQDGKDLRVKIRLDKSGPGFSFEFEDNGTGFDPDDALQRPDSFGLQSMKRWAKFIGATLEFTPKPGHGTAIRVTGLIFHGGGEE